MSDNPLGGFAAFKGDPRIGHGSEAMFSTLLWGANIAMAILHLPALGYRPYRFNKDTQRSQMEEAAAVKRASRGLIPLFPYHAPSATASSVPAMWEKEAAMRSWKAERQGAAVDQI